MKVGPNYLGDNIFEFIVWAPLLRNVELNIVSPKRRIVPMERDKWGYWRAIVRDIPPGILYLYRLEGKKDRPDPASHFQPDGVHEPSQVVNHQSFNWEDESWRGIH